MKRLIGYIGDRLQAAFPPNRLAILLAGPITAASVWVSGTVASNVPGVNLPVGVVAGVMGAAALITIRLLDRWFDQWQKGEPINVDGDLEQALDELADSPDVHTLYASFGTMQVVEEALEELRDHIHAGSINEAEVAKRVESLATVVAGFLDQHLEDRPTPPAPAVDAPEPPVASPPAAAVPPAAPQSPTE
jgi:hypothetical protein